MDRRFIFHLRSRTDLAWPSICANPLVIYRPGEIEHDARYGGSNGLPSWPVAQRNFERLVQSGGWSRSIVMMVRGCA